MCKNDKKVEMLHYKIMFQPSEENVLQKLLSLFTLTVVA